MKGLLSLLCLSCLVVSCAPEKGALPDAKSLHRALRGTVMPGYRFDRQVNEDSCIVTLQGPGMKSAWSLVVAYTQGHRGARAGIAPAGRDGAAVAGEAQPPNMVAVGTTVWRGNGNPSPQVLSTLLELNAVDLNPGSLSLYRDGQGGVFIQYTIRLPAHHLTTRDLEYALGYAAGYADGLQGKLAGISPPK